MDLDGRLWREASVAPDLDVFLDHVGATLLDELGGDAIAVRTIDHGGDDGGHRLDTVAWLRRGVLGVARPARPRTELRDAGATRLRAWIAAGEIEHVDGKARSAVGRDLLRGVGDGADGTWWLVPLATPTGALGALLVRASAPPRRRLAAIAEAMASLLAKGGARRELERLRAAADADRAAALARLHVHDLGVAVVGADTGLRAVMGQVEQVAATDAPALIVSEAGSGKEVVARAIHERSSRADGPFLRVHAGAIPADLVDAELFGVERSSAGAAQRRAGWFERADGGTLFLDEVGELPPSAQLRLLRVLDDGVIERVGGVRGLQVDVRVVAATHRDLRALAHAGRYSVDLVRRFAGAPIHLPPLRERHGDIAALAAHFAERAARRFGMPRLPLTAGDLAVLRGYPWPGNVRELSAVIERAAILGEGRRLDVERALGVGAANAGGAFPTLADAMRAHVERALERCRGRIDGPRGAALLLGVHPNTLRSRMGKLGVAAGRFRPEP